MLNNIEVLYHSSIRINKEKTIYIDPFKIEKNYNDADIIFVTHDHYDHYSEEDIDKVINENTVIVFEDGSIKNDCAQRSTRPRVLFFFPPFKNFLHKNASVKL